MPLCQQEFIHTSTYVAMKSKPFYVDRQIPSAPDTWCTYRIIATKLCCAFTHMAWISHRLSIQSLANLYTWVQNVNRSTQWKYLNSTERPMWQKTQNDKHSYITTSKHHTYLDLNMPWYLPFTHPDRLSNDKNKRLFCNKQHGSRIHCLVRNMAHFDLYT